MNDYVHGGSNLESVMMQEQLPHVFTVGGPHTRSRYP